MPKIGHYEAVCAEVIRLLKTERLRRKLTKYVIWQRSGVSQAMLSLVERGLRRPTMELMLRVADAVGADLPAIIKKATATVKKNPES